MPSNVSIIEEHNSDLLNLIKIMEKSQIRLSQQAQIIDQIQDSIITTDLKGNIISSNLGSELIFGYKEKDIIGKNINILYLKGNESIVNKNIDFIMKKNRFDTKVNLISKSKEILHIELTLSILKDKENNPIRIIYYSKDITYKEILNSEINKQEKIILEQSQHAAMGEMIGNIAHQWRQPLSVISTCATGMKVQKEYGLLPDDDFYKMCDSIDENAQYLSKTIDDFRNFIKGDSIKKNFNLKENINSFLSLVDSSIKTENLKVILDIDTNINIHNYPNELNQCFINIFNNSKDVLKNINDDKIILISSTIKNNNIVISFQDNGGGIKEDIINKIFEPYFTTKHQSQGTGLGLNMTYNMIINAMKGSIKAKNSNFIYNDKEYLGAEFLITLPIN